MISILLATAVLADVGKHDANPTLKAVAEIFAAERVVGTLVVAEADGKVVFVHNDQRSTTRFSPASTFKIPNTLIGLDLGILESAETPFIWDGKLRGVPAWNQDQTLRSAFEVSCVWCYQEIAREVGTDRYATSLASIDYGNQQIGDHVDTFWLNGELKISAREQIDFPQRLTAADLPFSREHIDVLKSVMVAEKGTAYTLYAKTGWTGPELHVGWYIGYVEKGNDTWLFALNMRMDQAAQAALRRDLAVRSLQALGVL